MDLTELLRITWQRKLLVAGVFVLIVGLGALSLVLQSSVYRASSTIALTPAPGVDDPIFIISQIDVITPLFAEAVETRDTLDRAERLLDDEPLGDVSVRTFRGAPILKIDVESASPQVASDGAQAVTDALLARVGEGDIGLSESIQLTQMERPRASDEPVRPQPRLTLAVCVVLGLGFGVVAAVAWDRLGRRIETADDLALATGISVYGEIPLDRAVPSIVGASALVHDDKHRVVAEALRDVRTNLQFAGGGLRSVAVTSPEGSHGKTFVGVGVAATMARSGVRTLLVDGDLRRGRVSERLGVARSPGLSEVMQGMPLAGAIQQTDLDGLSVLAGGAFPDDPGELLESSFFQVLYDLEAAFDFVVVDGTPLLPINDARIVARYTGAVLVVVAAGTVTRRQLRAATERLSIIGITPTAVVLNQSRRKFGSSYYRYLRTDA